MTYNVFMPTRCILGENAVAENSSLFASLGRKALIVTGKHGAEKSGALADAVSALEKENIGYAVYNGIGANPLVSSCHEAGVMARETGADFILGIGGGSALDSAKVIAIYASNGDLAPLDIYKRVYSNPPLPVALIGTTAGTGSEVTAVAVLTNDETGIKKSVKGPDCYAAVSFCDPKYTASLSYGVTVSTALDAFAHAVEGYFTEKCENITAAYAEKCIPSLYSNLKALVGKTEVDPSLREPLYYNSIYAGLVINTCGTGFPHPLGYVLTENYGVPHGTACAAFFGYFIDRCRKFSPVKAAKFEEMTEDIEKVKETIASLTFLKDIKIDAELAHKYSARWENVTPGNFLASPGSLTREEAEKMLIFDC
jgi:alcohol dehydrogenase class IV